ncbi:hypothetical protein M8J71_14345 [Pseudarthrobacter sp. R1]|uniref:hypothetical protein n=1 Tax=Pseudarthrobacter sp. R1 TaxID=2944934 RepID=UPI00210ADC50|nr:hypothetical protein [Pseudarthrobacter sp. R1]MCQ6271660.1 hypothetical protein [Pseudarthrobacter sp. R1]
MPSEESDSVLSRLIDSDEADAVTRAERCPISAPPGPIASAMDLVVVAEGEGVGASAGAGSTALPAGSVAGAGPTPGATVSLALAALLSAEPVGELVVGVGGGSTAEATPTRLGPATKELASRMTASDFMAGRRD